MRGPRQQRRAQRHGQRQAQELVGGPETGVEIER